MGDEFSRAAARISTGADVRAEAAQLVAAMTIEERLGCLDGDVPLWPGLIDMTSGGYYRHPWPAAHVERLGIPGIEFADGPRGCVLGDATAFPVSMARGAAFDPALEERIGEAIGAELRASGATFTGAVCMNLLRHPAWGRAQETYGEDPLHVGTMAAALTAGLQRHVMACMKHFALNSMENARFTVDVSVDERALHEVYLPHFRRVAAAGVASVMSAYNSVNGTWCGEHHELLTRILRDEWGWDGFVVSDFIFGLRDPVKSVEAGLDIEMPFRQQRATTLPAAVAGGVLDIAAVDDAAQRIVATLLRFARVFDHRPDPQVIGCDAHRALAHEAGVASTVLLRNDGVLPIGAAAGTRIAVLGHLAGRRNLGDGGSSDVRASHVVTPLDGLRARFGESNVAHSDADVGIVDGCDLVIVVVGYTKDDEGEYIDQAGTAPIAAKLFPPTDDPVVGTAQPIGVAWPPPPGGEPYSAAGDDELGMAAGGDRASLHLRADDEALIAAAAARHPRVVVAVVGGSAVVMPWTEQVGGVLMTWYSGVEGGTALASIVAGDAEPGGRLPFAVPTDESHLAFFDRDATAITYDLWHGQWKLDRDGHPAHFPFGWGLGYTDVAIGAARQIDDDHVEVSVANVGTRDGSTVVFVWAGLPASRFERPVRRLVGFAKVAVAAGETAAATIELDWSMLAVRHDGAWLTEPGTYDLTIGRHAGDPDAHVLRLER